MARANARGVTVEAIARIGSALGGGVKMAVDVARMAVGLTPISMPAGAALSLAASASEAPHVPPLTDLLADRERDASGDSAVQEPGYQLRPYVDDRIEWYLEDLTDH
jgi:hypothetical protein